MKNQTKPMTKIALVQSFLEPKKLAIAGVSRNPKKFGRVVYEHLKKRDFQVFGINPNSDSINGDPCFKTVADLPDEAENLYIVTPKNQTRDVIQAAIDRGIKNIWIQQASETKEAVELAEENNVNLIHKECIFKFAEPVTGPHNFHRFISKVFGAYPK